MKEWGSDFKKYSLDPAFQLRVQSLIRQFKYRLDTNFAKIDRIEHPELEQFKTKILATNYAGKAISEWAGLIAAAEEDESVAGDLRQFMKLDI